MVHLFVSPQSGKEFFISAMGLKELKISNVGNTTPKQLMLVKFKQFRKTENSIRHSSLFLQLFWRYHTLHIFDIWNKVKVN